MRTEEVRAALAKKFPSPEYALFHEVANSTGGGAGRTADAIAMGLWPSRGLHLQGFEIKVSRSDWRSELKNPAKAEEIARFCRYWWIVTPPGIVKDDELPSGWGLYEVHGNGVRCIKQAPVNEGLQPITMPFLAALLRRADEHAKRSLRAEVARETAVIRERSKEQVTVQVEERTRHLQSADQDARDTLEKIKSAAGAEPGKETDRLFGRWFDAEGFGRAVGLVHKMGVTSTYRGLRSVQSQLRPLLDLAERMGPLLDAMGEDDAEGI